MDIWRQVGLELLGRQPLVGAISGWSGRTKVEVAIGLFGCCLIAQLVVML